jgi:hypothetical protein
MGLIGWEHDWDEEYRSRQAAVTAIDFYSVEMSLETDGGPQIQTAIPFMRDYAPHPRKIPGVYVVEFRSKRIPGLNTFKVELEYNDEITQQVNPLSIPPVITGTKVARQIPRLTDADGKVKCNTAGDLFDDPPPLVTVYDRVYKVVKNIPTKPPDWVDGYINCTNSDSVTLKGRVWEPGTVLYVPGDQGVDDVGGPQQNIPYMPYDFELHCRADGWKDYIPNMGFNEIIPLPANSPLLGTPLDAKSQKGIATIPGQLPDDQVVDFKKGIRYVRRKILIGAAREQPNEKQALDKNGRAIAVPTIDNIVLVPFNDYTPQPFNGVLPLK